MEIVARLLTILLIIIIGMVFVLPFAMIEEKVFRNVGDATRLLVKMFLIAFKIFIGAFSEEEQDRIYEENRLLLDSLKSIL